jgi:hypothetical protein
MKKSEIALLVLACSLIAFSAGLVFGIAFTIDHYRKQAVARGFADFEVNGKDTSIVDFHWKQSPPNR